MYTVSKRRQQNGCSLDTKNGRSSSLVVGRISIYIYIYILFDRYIKDEGHDDGERITFHNVISTASLLSRPHIYLYIYNCRSLEFVEHHRFDPISIGFYIEINHLFCQ